MRIIIMQCNLTAMLTELHFSAVNPILQVPRLSDSPAFRGCHPHFRAFTRAPAESDKSPAFSEFFRQHNYLR